MNQNDKVYVYTNHFSALVPGPSEKAGAPTPKLFMCSSTTLVSADHSDLEHRIEAIRQAALFKIQLDGSVGVDDKWLDPYMYWHGQGIGISLNVRAPATPVRNEDGRLEFTRTPHEPRNTLIITRARRVVLHVDAHFGKANYVRTYEPGNWETTVLEFNKHGPDDPGVLAETNSA